MDNIFLNISKKILFPIYSSFQVQTYFGIVLYLFLAIALCGILAAAAYLFSLSAVQDSEKRSEYECGFEPFDSATRLPFDVHFYLVGILFLIFDVEIALLFPWVLSLRTTGWFGFYLMFGFIFLLAVGFLYEWKRGALIWPSRQRELTYYTTNAKYNLICIFLAVTKCTKHGKEVPYIESDAFIADLALALTVLVIVAAVVGYPIFVAAVFKASKLSKTRAQLVKRAREKKIQAAQLPSTPRSTKLEGVELVKRINLLQQGRLAKHIKATNDRMKTNKLKNPVQYFKAIQSLGALLQRNKKKLQAHVTKIAMLVKMYRSKARGKVREINALEERAQFALVPATLEYRKIAVKRKTLYKQYNKNLRRAKKPTAVARTIKAYLTAHMRSRKTPKQKAIEMRLLHKVKSECLGRTKMLRRPRSTAKNRARKQKRTFRKIALLPLVSVSFGDSYFTQFTIGLLPEMCLTAMITAMLVLLATNLGARKCKKNLALRSRELFCTGLVFIAVLYAIQLNFGITGELFSGYAITSSYTTALKLLTTLSGLFILHSSGWYIYGHKRHLLEYPLILTLAILFMLLLIGAGNLVSAFIALVGFSLNLYVLILFDATTAVAREAGVKYFYLSTISSGLMLYGVFLLFLITGSGNLAEIGQVLATESELVASSNLLLSLAITLILIGLFFKLSAFPGHLWAAEVYEGSPDPITAFFMLPVKVAVLAFVMQLLATALEGIAAIWQPLVALGAAFSLIWGCLAALVEKKTKRFLAYTSINQIGFLLLGLASGSFEGYRTTMFYLLIYAIMNAGFLVIFLNARRANNKTGLLYLTEFRGIGQHYKHYSWSFAIILLSMAGIPPLAGFFGKYYLLLHAQEQELYGLVVIGLITSLISTYYYLRVIKIMWFEGRRKMTGAVCHTVSTANETVLHLSEWSLWAALICSGYVLNKLDLLTISAIAANSNFFQV